jgi:integrase
MFRESSGTWRLRSRSRHFTVDLGCGTSDLAAAKRIAKAHLDGRAKDQQTQGSETLEQVVKAYATMPKRCAERAATDNVQRLRSIVRLAWGRELAQVKLSDLSPKLWRDFMAEKMGGILDLATRRPGNAAINAAVRSAASIFIPRLRPAYAELGFTVPTDATVIQWLPVMQLPPAVSNDTALVTWWESLEAGSPEWFAVGLARFAGLRSAEVAACRPEWLEGDCISLRDRPEQGFLTKTGKPYRALVLRPELAEAIRALPHGVPVVQPATAKREEWFERDLPRLVRPFSPSAKKPFHRLRGLYADHVARVTQDAVAARLAGVREASAALGHTTTATTLNHYLSPQ